MLVVIDAFSKYALAQPIKKKTGKEVTEAFGRISKEAQGRKPQKLETDAGKEFYSSTFQEFVKSHGIHHFSTHGDAKASVAERFIHTLKSKLYRYFTAANTLKYVDVSKTGGSIQPHLSAEYSNHPCQSHTGSEGISMESFVR